MRLLSDHEAVTELLSLMKENGRKLNAAELSYMIYAIDHIDKQYSELLSMIQDRRDRLAEAAAECYAAGAEAPDFSEFQVVQKEAEQVLSKVAAVKEKIVIWAKAAVEDFKQIGVSALDTAMSTLNVHSMLWTLRRQARSSTLNIIATIQRAETMGQEMRSMGGHLKNVIWVIQGKAPQVVDGGQEGRFQSVILAPMRAVRKMLSVVSNATLAAIGGVEHLSESAEAARKARAERAAQKPGKRLEKKPSIRQALQKNQAEVAARSAPAPDRDHGSPEAAL